MFDISFTGEIVDTEGEILYLGVIKLGDVTEGFTASFSFWSKGDYQKQWLEATRRLLEPDSRSAFITCMYDPDKAEFIDWWPIWRVGNLVILQEHILFIGAKEGDDHYNPWAVKFSIDNPYAAIPDRDSTHCKECQKTGICRHPKLGQPLPDKVADICPVEWCVRIEEIEEFLKHRKCDWAS